MNCDCGEKLRVTHTYSVPGGKTQRLACASCPLVYTAAVLLVTVDPERGEGAAALAERLRNGSLSLSAVGAGAPKR